MIKEIFLVPYNTLLHFCIRIDNYDIKESDTLFFKDGNEYIEVFLEDSYSTYVMDYYGSIYNMLDDNLLVSILSLPINQTAKLFIDRKPNTKFAIDVYMECECYNCNLKYDINPIPKEYNELQLLLKCKNCTCRLPDIKYRPIINDKELTMYKS